MFTAVSIFTLFVLVFGIASFARYVVLWDGDRLHVFLDIASLIEQISRDAGYSGIYSISDFIEVQNSLITLNDNSKVRIVINKLTNLDNPLSNHLISSLSIQNYTNRLEINIPDLLKGLRNQFISP